MNKFLVLACAMLVAISARGQSLEEQYINIHTLIQEGDALNENRRYVDALEKYQQARNWLQRFEKGNPQWNKGIVAYRLGDLTAKITVLATNVPAQVLSASSAPPGGRPAEAGSTNFDGQIGSLQAQVKQLQAENSVLQAKLKESLSVQPAASDPRELARAESRVQSLQKENELLKVTLDQEKAKAVDTNTLADLRNQLAETSQRLSAQADAATRLEQERRALQRKLDAQLPSARGIDSIQKTQTELATVNNQVRELKEIIQKLTAEREALQTRVKTLSAENEAAVALRAENEFLKKQVADLKSSKALKGKPADLARQLTEAQTQIAALRSELDVLRLERTALQERVKQMVAKSESPGETAAAALPAPFTASEAKRIQELERERNDLQKKLASARDELSNRKAKPSAGRVADLEKEVASLRARLEVLEAQPVPYSAEELALFKFPPALAAGTSRATGSTPPPNSSPPPGTSAMVAEARRLFVARQFPEAEQKYREVLNRDERNVFTLANLASIQVETGRYTEAEKSLASALSLSPNDPFALWVMGKMRFQQAKYDEALEVLSRAAKADPQSPDIQNLLGVTLGQKGQRAAAETALRKAVQLDANYADAHQNLAAIYLGQDPPATELARWHYQKAQANGAARNPKIEEALQPKSK